MQDACAGLIDPKTEFNPLNILLNWNRIESLNVDIIKIEMKTGFIHTSYKAGVSNSNVFKGRIFLK